MKMKRKILRIAAFCAAMALIFGVACFANALVGNPISKAVATKTAKAYVEDHYAGMGYAIDTVSYSFKDGNYYAHLKTEKSMDGDFSLCISMTGQLQNDDYDSRVTHHGNLVRRLYMAYRERVDEVLESAVYPYEFSIGFGDLEFDYELGKEPNPLMISKAELVNDRFYDVGKLGETNGRIVLYIDSETVDEKTAGEMLLTTKKLLSDAGVGFYDIDLVLEYPPYDEESYQRPEGKIRIEGFLSDDIYEEGLADRIHAAHERTQAEYAEDDGEK